MPPAEPGAGTKAGCTGALSIPYEYGSEQVTSFDEFRAARRVPATDLDRIGSHLMRKPRQEPSVVFRAYDHTWENPSRCRRTGGNPTVSFPASRRQRVCPGFKRCRAEG